MSQPVYWKMRNGVLISIDDMDVNHLRNVLKMIVNNSSKHQEKKFTLNGDMAEQFNHNDDEECDATEIDFY
jgi:hypothetical protein